jgi:hypothetical protein
MSRLARSVAVLAAAGAALAAGAQTIKDPQWAQWMEARRFGEVEAAASARLAARADDSLTDAGAFDAAIAQLELASRLEGGKDLPVDYRLGIALQAKGERDKARAALSRYVTAGKGNPKNLDDAKKRLAELG